jgi:hypothetical protein
VAADVRGHVDEMNAFPGLALGFVIASVPTALVYREAQRRGLAPRRRRSPEETKAAGRRAAGAAIGVGVVAMYTRANAFPPRSLLAWIAVAAIAIVPVTVLAALLEGWSQRTLSEEEYERVTTGHFPSKESGVRGRYILLGSGLVAILIALLYVGTEFVGV